MTDITTNVSLIRPILYFIDISYIMDKIATIFPKLVHYSREIFQLQISWLLDIDMSGIHTDNMHTAPVFT